MRFIAAEILGTQIFLCPTKQCWLAECTRNGASLAGPDHGSRRNRRLRADDDGGVRGCRCSRRRRRRLPGSPSRAEGEADQPIEQSPAVLDRPPQRSAVPAALGTRRGCIRRSQPSCDGIQTRTGQSRSSRPGARLRCGGRPRSRRRSFRKAIRRRERDSYARITAPRGTRPAWAFRWIGR